MEDHKELEELEKEKERRKAERRKAWDRRELVSVGTKLRPKVAAEFEDWCYLEDKTPYAMIKELVMAYLRMRRTATYGTQQRPGSH